MPEFQFPDMYGAAMRGYAHGQQIRDDREKRSRLAELESLAPQAIQGDRAAQERAYAIDPTAAKQYEGAGDRRREQLVQMAKGYKQLQDPMQRQAFYERFVHPAVSQMGFGDLGAYDDAEVSGVADQIIAAYDQPRSVSNVQSTFIDDKGQRVAIMRDGTTQILGANAPNNQIIDTGNGFFGVNKGNLSAAPVTIGQPQLPQAAGKNPQEELVMQAANAMIQNGVPDAQVEAWVQERLSQGVEMSPQSTVGNQLRSTPKPAAPSDFDRKLDFARQMGATPDQLRNMALGSAAPDAAKGATAAEIKEATARRMKRPQLNNLERGIGNIESALADLDQGVIGTSPATGRGLSLTEKGQRLDTAVGAIQESLLSLTRVPGIGAQSDLEARIANLKYPKTGNYANNNKMLIDNLRAIVQDIGDAYRSMEEDDDAIIQSRSRQPQAQKLSLDDDLIEKYLQ